MSGEAVGWVFKHSPYDGASFTLHLGAADVANDMHGNELWFSQASLAAKCRVSRETVNRWLKRAVEDGFLEILEDNSRQRKANRYRFLMPKMPVVWGEGASDDRSHDDSTCDDRSHAHVTTDHMTSDDRSHAHVTRDHTKTQLETQDELKEKLKLSRESEKPDVVHPEIVDFPMNSTRATGDTDFDRFWTVYPRKVGKGAARKAWTKAMEITTAETIMDAMSWQAEPLMARGVDFCPHASTWLNAERWADEPPPPPDPSTLTGMDAIRYVSRLMEEQGL